MEKSEAKSSSLEEISWEEIRRYYRNLKDISSIRMILIAKSCLINETTDHMWIHSHITLAIYFIITIIFHRSKSETGFSKISTSYSLR